MTAKELYERKQEISKQLKELINERRNNNQRNKRG